MVPDLLKLLHDMVGRSVSTAIPTPGLSLCHGKKRELFLNVTYGPNLTSVMIRADDEQGLDFRQADDKVTVRQVLAYDQGKGLEMTFDATEPVEKVARICAQICPGPAAALLLQAVGNPLFKGFFETY